MREPHYNAKEDCLELENTKWSYDHDSKTLRIWGSGDMVECDEVRTSEYRELLAHWRVFASRTKNVVIEEGVTSISEEAFSGFMLMESLSISNSVKTIGELAFRDCASLRVIEIPGGVTEIKPRSFFNCYGLEDATVSESNPVYYSESGVIFRRDGTLIFYPPSKKDEIYHVPAGTKVIGFEAFGFNSNDNLKQLFLPKGLQKVDGWIQIPSLTDVFIPEDVEDISPTIFTHSSCCPAFHVDEGNKAFKSIDGVIYSKDGRTLIVHPDPKEGTTYEIPEWVEEIQFGMDSVKSYNVSEGNKVFKSIDGVLFSKDGGTLIRYPDYRVDCEYTVPEGVRSISRNAFYGCPGLEIVNMPDSLEYVSELAFTGCDDLKEVRLTHIPQNVKGSDNQDPAYDDIEGWFNECDNVELIVDGKTFMKWITEDDDSDPGE